MNNTLRQLGLALGIVSLTALLASCAPPPQNQSTSTGSGETKSTESSTASSSTSSTSSAPSSGGVPAPGNDDPEAKKGMILFVQQGCNACHMNPASGKDYPDLRGLYGSKVKLADGSEVVADEAYLKESIVDPNKKVVAGYTPSMASYSYLKEEQINQLIAYIKSLKDQQPVYTKEAK
ncbi:MAG: cytochrome c [Armatimonadetes bacterium]|nr:cytochrome c [Armatimonadota bacterium]CUU38014.1 Cytochrome c2 [Armatimonadetes bacterium DC]